MYIVQLLVLTDEGKLVVLLEQTLDGIQLDMPGKLFRQGGAKSNIFIFNELISSTCEILFN